MAVRHGQAVEKRYKEQYETKTHSHISIGAARNVKTPVRRVNVQMVKSSLAIKPVTKRSSGTMKEMKKEDLVMRTI